MTQRQKAKLFASILWLAAVCALLCARPAHAEQSIPVARGSYAWNTWHSTYRFDPQFSSMNWGTFRDEVLFPLNKDVLKGQKGDKPYRHLARKTEIKFPDLGTGVSSAELDRLKTEYDKKLADQKKTSDAEFKRLNEELKKARAGIVPLYQSWWMILIYIVLAAAIAFVLGLRQHKDDVIVRRLTVDDVAYDAGSISVLRDENRAFQSELKELREMVHAEFYEHPLPKEFRRLNSTSRFVYFKRAGANTVVIKGIPHPVEISNINEKLDRAEDTLLTENGIEWYDRSASRRILRKPVTT